MKIRGFHISHDLQLLIDSGDADALAALSDHTADTDGWDDEFLPGYASGASDDGVDIKPAGFSETLRNLL